MIPRPKYEIGQKVWRGGTAWSSLTLPCPDCLGSKTWRVTTPANEDFEIPCATCEQGWYCTGRVSEYRDLPRVSDLTIGSIQIDTNDKENPVRYMCIETGVGTGSIYNENELFPDKAAAEAHASKLTEERSASRAAAFEEHRKQLKKRSRYKPKKPTNQKHSGGM